MWRPLEQESLIRVRALGKRVLLKQEEPLPPNILSNLAARFLLYMHFLPTIQALMLPIHKKLINGGGGTLGKKVLRGKYKDKNERKGRLS